MSPTREKTVAEVLERILVKGVPLHATELHNLGLDVGYLSETFDIVKSQLWQLPEYRLLKDISGTKSGKERWLRIAEASEYGDVPCVRLTSGQEDLFGVANTLPLLRLLPEASGPHVYVEVFVTFRGEWLVYHDSSELPNAGVFARRDSVEELCAYLEELSGDGYRYSASARHAYSCAYAIADRLVELVRKDIGRHGVRIKAEEAVLADHDRLHSRFFRK